MANVVELIKQDIGELADTEKQRSYWLGKDHKHISSYVELMNRLFDDNGLDDFIDNAATLYGVPQEIVDRLNDIRSLLNKYEEMGTDAEIIEDPEWINICNKAKVLIARWV